MPISSVDANARATISRSADLTNVRAGSALVRVGDRLLVIPDDEFSLHWVDPASLVQADQPLRGVGGSALPKSEKPDFEAACDLPDGRILIIGSGSADTRRMVVLLDPTSGDFQIADAVAVYRVVESSLGGPVNLEGVVAAPGGLLLFHRGNAVDGSRVIDLSLDPARPDLAQVRGSQEWDLGAIPAEGRPVPLAFTDAHRAADGRIWYLAAAEDTPNAIDDGPVVGAALGILGPGPARWCPITEADGGITNRKPEGLVVDPDGRGAWLVTDPDDEHARAQLCRLELSGWE